MTTLQPIKTKFITDKIKAFETKSASGEPEYHLKGIASSTVVDRQGDRIDSTAQVQMEAQSKGLTMFLNHSYNVPEDIFGTCGDSYLERSIDASQGECVDLIIDVKVNTENERAMKTWRAVNKGTSLGFSIGAEIVDYGFEGDTLVISGVNLYEISCVGIPANQRAMISDVMAKSIRKSLTSEDNSRSIKSEELSQEVAAPTLEPAVPENVDKHVDEAVEQPNMDIQKSGRRLSADTIKCLTESMDHMHKAKAHGVCADASSHLDAAHKCLMSLVSDENNADDPNTGEDPDMEDVNLALNPEDDSTVVKSVVEPEVVVVAEEAPADTALVEKQAEVDALVAEVASLKTQMEALKAIPAGRVSLPTGSTIHATADPEARKNGSEASYTAELTALMNARK